MVGAIGPLFRTAGHKVRTQHAVTASAGQRRRDVEIRYYLQDTAGRWSLVFDLSMTHDRFGSSRHVHQKGLKKIHSYRWQALFLAFLATAPKTVVGHGQVEDQDTAGRRLVGRLALCNYYYFESWRRMAAAPDQSGNTIHHPIHLVDALLDPAATAPAPPVPPPPPLQSAVGAKDSTTRTSAFRHSPTVGPCITALSLL